MRWWKCLSASLVISLFASQAAFADVGSSRVLLDTPNGKTACVVQGNAYADCIPVALQDVSQRVLLQTPNGVSACVWAKNSFTDCVAVAKDGDGWYVQQGSDGDLTCLPMGSNSLYCAPQESWLNSRLDYETNLSLNDMAQNVPAADPALAAVDDDKSDVFSDNSFAKALDSADNTADSRASASSINLATAGTYDKSASEANDIANLAKANLASASVNLADAADSSAAPEAYYYDQPSYDQPAQVYQTAETASLPESSSAYSYWDDQHGIQNGLFWGMSLGWYGQFYDGHNDVNSFVFAGTLGAKWTHLGFAADFDISVGSWDEDKDATYWTYGVYGMLMFYIPIVDNVMQVFGFGVGYTGWSADYMWTERYLMYDRYWDEFYYEDYDYSQNIDDGSHLSLKVKARIELVDEWGLGLEIDWIPMIDPDKKGNKIINNMVGIQLYFGEILELW